MEVKTKERKLIYYPIESNEIVERNLDDFIIFMLSKDFCTGEVIAVDEIFHYEMNDDELPF